MRARCMGLYKNAFQRVVFSIVSFTMSLSRCFSLIGDSNVKRHMNPTNCRDRPLMSGCQVIPCMKMSTLAESLKSVRTESNVCIVACITNFLTGSTDSGVVSHRIVPILQDFLEAINAAALSSPGRSYLVSPPMYRKSPLWYRDCLPEVMTRFSEIMSGRRDSVHLLASFSNPDFDDDGIHLSPYSGLEYVLHLFDEAVSVLDAIGSSISETASKTSEVSRVLQDRVMALEQDHRRLNLAFECKTAEDSEMSDFHENVRTEDWFVISGLTRLPSGLSPKDWQVQTIKDVQGVLSILFPQREFSIAYVQNNTGRHKDAKAKYFVQMRSVEDSKLIRDTFGSFFVGGKPSVPPALKHISIRNRVTPGTLVRVAILRIYAERYLASNPGAKVKVVGYEPRPMLKLTPPPSATSDSRTQVYNFIQAVRSLPSNFNSSEQEKILREVNPKLLGKLRPLFVVINDDMVKRSRRTGSRPASSDPAAAGSDAPASNVTTSSTSPPSGSGSGSGSGPKTSRSGSGSGSKSGRSGRGEKRPPSPILGGSEKHSK